VAGVEVVVDMVQVVVRDYLDKDSEAVLEVVVAVVLEDQAMVTVEMGNVMLVMAHNRT